VVVKHREKIIDEINKQAINSEIALYIEEELVEIFGLYEDVNDDDFEDDDPNFDEDDDKKNENQDNQGGLGTGDVIFDGFDAENIYVNVSTGDITGTILSSKLFIAESGTGDVEVPRTYEGGKCILTTGTGDIYITYK
jgi:hypothetical protein